LFAAHFSSQPHGYADLTTDDTPPLQAIRGVLKELEGWYLVSGKPPHLE